MTKIAHFSKQTFALPQTTESNGYLNLLENGITRTLLIIKSTYAKYNFKSWTNFHYACVGLIIQTNHNPILLTYQNNTGIIRTPINLHSTILSKYQNNNNGHDHLP